MAVDLSVQLDVMMQGSARRIGPVGTSFRALFGLGFLYFGLFDGVFTWGLAWWEAVVGLILFPALMVSIGLAAKRFADGPLRATGAGAVALNLVVLVALVSVLETRDAAFLFYGVSLLLAAWRALPDCEITVLSNVLLRRDDQIGCPVFSPIDQAEAGLLGKKM